MAKQAETVICKFYRLIPDAPLPRPADRSADGMLPTRGYRYCEALAVRLGVRLVHLSAAEFQLGVGRRRDRVDL